MPNKTITFGADLLPVTSNSYNLGDSTHIWNIYGDLTGSASQVSAVEINNKKIYLLGSQTLDSTTASAVNLNGDTKVYLTTTTGELSALKYSVHDTSATPVEKVRMEWNSNDDSLDFIFV